MEVDFPRGAPKGEVKTNQKGKVHKQVKEKPAQTSSKPKKSVKSAAQFNVTPSTLHADMLLLGCVTAVGQHQVQVELPNNIMGTLHGQSPDHFRIGQWLAVGVMPHAGTEAHTESVPLTVDPATINRSMGLHHLRPGMYISGVVSSIEDRGYSVDTSISDTSSFITTTQNLSVGQPVFCVITEISVEAKRIFLTPQQDTAATFKGVQDWKSITLENVRPGNAAKAEVTYKFSNGLGVKIYSQPATSPLSAFIPAAHLPNPVRSYSVGFRMNSKILYVDYRSQKVMLTALPHIINHVSNEEVYREYMRLRGKVFSVPAPSIERPITEIPTVPPSRAVIQSNSVDQESADSLASDPTQNEKPWADVKVVGVSFLLNAVTASADRILLENDNAVLQVSDLRPGMTVNGKVSVVSNKGIEVQISPAIDHAICQSTHLTDAPVLQNVSAVFKEDQQVHCRVLSIDDDDTVHITNKPKLVNSSLHIITSYLHALPGCVAHGWISKVTSTGVSVSFYNNVTGTVPSSDIKGAPGSIYHVGEVVVCQVVECKDLPTTNSYSLTLSFDIQLARPVPNTLGISALRSAFSAVNIGEVVSGVVSHTDLSGLTLVLDSGGSAILPTQHLSDSQVVCSKLLARYYVGTKLSDLLVLNKDSSNMRLVLSKKRSLQSLPSSHTNVKCGQILPAHIKQISDAGITIGFLGTNKAVVSLNQTSAETNQVSLNGVTPQVRNTMLHSTNSYAVGQSVRVVVREVEKNGSLKVDLFDEETKTNGLLLLQEYFAGIDALWSRMKMAKLSIGDVVEGAVVEYWHSRLIIRLVNNLLAFVETSSTHGHYQKGKAVKGVVVDLDYSNATVQLSLDQDLVERIADTSLIKVGESLIGTVLLCRGEYSVVCVTPAKHKRALVYVPVCDYNTQGMTHSLLGPQIGQSILVEKGADLGAEKRPLFAVKEVAKTPNDGQAKQAKESVENNDELKESDSEETDDLLDGAMDALLETDDADSVFQYVEESDDEVDPDADSLQEYLARESLAKGKREAENPIPKTKLKPKGSKVDAKQPTKRKSSRDVQETEHKQQKKPRTTTISNKKAKNK